LGYALKEAADEIVGIGAFGVVGQGFAYSNHGIISLNLSIVDGSLDEVRLRNTRAGKFQQLGRSI
jgi:hypothetical protein